MKGKTPIQVLTEIKHSGQAGLHTFALPDTGLTILVRHELIEIVRIKSHPVARITDLGIMFVTQIDQMKDRKEKRIAVLVQMVKAIEAIDRSTNMIAHLKGRTGVYTSQQYR